MIPFQVLNHFFFKNIHLYAYTGHKKEISKQELAFKLKSEKVMKMNEDEDS